MKSNHSNSPRGSWLWVVVPLFAVLGIFFFRSVVPGQVLFANDGPLGASVAKMYRLPAGFFGAWNDLYWLGTDSGSFPPNSWGTMRFLFGPLGYVNFSPPVSLLFCGLCAALFFRALGFNTMVCSLGALAAALNGNLFSNACWGLPSRATATGMAFLALAALHSSMRGSSFMRTALRVVFAGFAVGMAISEASDNGVIFSLFVAAFGLFAHYWGARDGGSALPKAVVKAMAIVGLVAICAVPPVVQTFLMSKSSYENAVGKAAAMSPEQRWNWATQWSLPPVETLRVIVPGLFGYRMDTPDGGNYWGGVGRDLSFDQTRQGFPRHSGAGEYAGVLVVLGAAWALANSLRRKDSAYSAPEKRTIWFWGGAALVALVIAWGHHAPFYYFIYKLPFFSAMRNPMKFMHAFHLCVMILFGYGLQGLWRRYLEPAKVTAQPFEKKWLLGSFAAVGLGILSMAVFAMASGSVSRYLSNEGFEGLSREIVKHTAGELFWATFFLAVSVIAVWMIQKGTFAGAKGKWAGVFLGLILTVDFARANSPWILYYNWKEKYASNPVLDILKKDPHLHRVTLPPLRVNQQYDFLSQYYGVEWLQHQFQYYNIQALDVSQEPRVAPDKYAYQQALMANPARYWQLTNTRYLLGLVGFAESLNAQLDPGLRRFRTDTPFTLVQKPGTTLFDAQTNSTGPFALIEFTGALPRAKLYAQWESITNEEAALRRLADPAFDPFQSVIVSDAIAAPAPGASNAAPGTVEFVSYAPKVVKLNTSAAGPTLLLLNDRFHSDWKVSVDGKPETMLRCNYVVRGVRLPPGNHTVTFSFEPRTMFWWTFSVVVAGMLLGAVIVFWWFCSEDDVPLPTARESKEVENKNLRSPIQNPKS